MGGPDQRRRAVPDAVDQVTEAIGPRPGGVELLVGSPGTDLALVEVVALGRPVVPVHLERAARAVQFERRGAVLLDREPRRDQAQRRVAEVQQHLGENWVRSVAMSSSEGLKRGMKVNATGAAISVPVGEGVLGRVFNVTGDPVDEQGPVKFEKPELGSRQKKPADYVAHQAMLNFVPDVVAEQA